MKLETLERISDELWPRVVADSEKIGKHSENLISEAWNRQISFAEANEAIATFTRKNSRHWRIYQKVYSAIERKTFSKEELAARDAYVAEVADQINRNLGAFSWTLR